MGHERSIATTNDEFDDVVPHPSGRVADTTRVDQERQIDPIGKVDKLAVLTILYYHFK